MARYTQLGIGDATPDYPEDTRPQCKHCLEHFTESEELDAYCSARCWYLDNIGEYKTQIMLCVKLGMTEQEIIKTMENYGWFESITDASVNRFKRAIHALFEVKLAKAA